MHTLINFTIPISPRGYTLVQRGQSGDAAVGLVGLVHIDQGHPLT